VENALVGLFDDHEQLLLLVLLTVEVHFRVQALLEVVAGEGEEDLAADLSGGGATRWKAKPARHHQKEWRGTTKVPVYAATALKAGML
jgi:hypothetical protein